MLWDRVRAGETLNMLSARLGRPACMIMRANRLISPAWLLPGREIIVPPEDFCAWDAGECPNRFFRCPAREARTRTRCLTRPGERAQELARRCGLPERLVLLALGGRRLDGVRELRLPAPPPGARIVTVLPGQTVESMVTKHAVPPITFDTGSARNTPSVPSPPIIGRKIVSGTTMMTFLKSEKNTACFGRLSAT